MIVFLYGPPGSGKSTCGARLAESLALPFYDLDLEIEAHRGLSIPEIFAAEGEAGFRQSERQALREMAKIPAGVIALGGGALLDPSNRSLAEASGQVLCLNAERAILLQRINNQQPDRPLLSEDLATQLGALLAARKAHYASFPLQVNTTHLNPEETAWQAQVELGFFRVTGMGQPYSVLIRNGSLDVLGQRLMEVGCSGPVMLVSDEQVGPIYADWALQSLQQAGYACQSINLPAGEAHKTLDTVARLWESFLAAGLDRRSTVVALGGGVVTDLAGFAAGAFLRGVRWVAVPASLLGMVDASLGGKTGADLPQGKNLVGLFHPPSLVLADPALLSSLEIDELRNGMAEVIKQGVIGDSALFSLLERMAKEELESTSPEAWQRIVRQAAAVKVRVLLADPYEQGLREVLNFGHTIGHAVEKASGYRIRHGEAVAIGMVAETRLAENCHLAEPGLARRIEKLLTKIGLPTEIPGQLDREVLLQSLRVDKKRRGGKQRLALPQRIGEVQPGVEFEEEDLWQQCLSYMDQI